MEPVITVKDPAGAVEALSEKALACVITP